VSLCDKSVSAQAFAIYSKVKQVNEVMTPHLQNRLFEVHPEVSFWAIANCRPMSNSKKKREGFEERRLLLTEALNMPIPSREQARSWSRPAGADDVLDAIVAAWTARRVAERQAHRLPPDPDLDANNLRMEIVF
jgi:predicted RNase H-like nuclease